MTDKDRILKLTDRLLEHAIHPEQEAKKLRWANHQALLPTDRTPVSVYYEGIPKKEWEHMFGQDFLQCSGATARELEYNLKRILWMAEHVPDDHIVWPMVQLNAPVEEKQGWGVNAGLVHSNDELGAGAFAAPFKDGYDLSKLMQPIFTVNQVKWADKLEEARQLTGGLLDIYPIYHNLGTSPFDVAAHMRGLETIMYDPFDCPETLHAIMSFITDAHVAHQKAREAEGAVSCVTDRSGKFQPVVGFRIHCVHKPEGNAPKLAHEWAYVSAQTSSGFGPDMYAEFVHPYNVKMAELFPGNTVYYHGCEPLDQKMDTIKALPHLRRFHVSPWSSLPKAVQTFRGSVVMEVHAHPTQVMMGRDERAMRTEIRKLIHESEGLPMDLNLSDIHSVSSHPETLTLWAQIAREEAEQSA